jgi:hypothetical protein
MEIRVLLLDFCVFSDGFCMLAELSDTQASLKLSNHIPLTSSFPMPM